MSRARAQAVLCIPALPRNSPHPLCPPRVIFPLRPLPRRMGLPPTTTTADPSPCARLSVELSYYEFQQEEGGIGLRVLPPSVRDPPTLGIHMRSTSPQRASLVLPILGTGLTKLYRKRRCDAAKPTCQNCVEADVECHYDDTPSQR